jgi:very-short-patch-repair endonuclease
LVSRTVEQAAVLGVLDVPEVDLILSGPRRRGSPCLRRILEHWRRYPPKTRLRSRMEAKLLPLLSQRDIPIPECNGTVVLGGESFEIDFLWRPQRLAVEADGRRFHDNPLAQARDRHRDTVLKAAGYRVPRLGWDDLRDRPDSTLSEIARLLHASPAVPLHDMRS